MGVSNISHIRSQISPPTIALSVGVAVSAIAISFGIHGLTPGFVVSALNATVVSALPGSVVTVGILGMGSTAQSIGFVLSALTLTLVYSVYTGIGLWLKPRLRNTMVSIVIPVVGIWTTETLITAEPTVAVYSAFGGGATLFFGHLAATIPVTKYTPSTIQSPDRRRVLTSGIGVVSAIMWGVSTGQQNTITETLTDVNEQAALEATDTVTRVQSKSLAVDSLTPLVSESFFEVDINAINPSLTTDDYQLTVQNNHQDITETYSYDDIVSAPTETQTQTLRCVGEPRNGVKMDTAVWTVVPLTEFIDFDAHDDMCCVMLRAADGYYERFPLAALQNGFIAYGMNGDVLPRNHGYPVRALIPGHWGEINVKWLTEIDILTEHIEGYWEKRGWHGTGPVNTVAKLHVVNTTGDSIEIAGHAYAGTRGVSAVEVSTDNGKTWSEATVSEAINDTDVWRQWVYEYTATKEHTVVVRAIEADGTVQTSEETGAYPDGARGYVSRTITP